VRRELFYSAIDPQGGRRDSAHSLLYAATRLPLLVQDDDFREVLVREVLQRPDPGFALSHLILNTPDDEERGRLFRFYREKDAFRAGLMIRHSAAELVPRLPNDVVRELLASEKADIRLRVISALGAQATPPVPAREAARSMAR
jgi:hypothetical protein